MALSPIPCCATCQVTTSNDNKSLLRCAGCKVVFYCSSTHQQAHWSTHKGACTSIRKATGTFDREEADLRASPGDFATPPGDEIFNEENVGHFWGIHETRGYMRARYALVESLLKIKTYAAVEAAHGHVMDLLRLSTSDNMGVRYMAPGLKLRLRDREAECYDFCKAWVMADQNDTLDEMDSAAIRGGKDDVLENPRGLFDGDFLQLGHMVAVTLIKIRLLLEVRALRNMRLAALRKKMPVEIEEAVKKHVVHTSVLAGRRDIMDGTAEGVTENLEAQVNVLIKAVDKYNPFFWPILRSPGRHMKARPEYYSPKSLEEAQMQLHSSHAAWAETEGAFAVLDEMIWKES